MWLTSSPWPRRCCAVGNAELALMSVTTTYASSHAMASGLGDGPCLLLDLGHRVILGLAIGKIGKAVHAVFLCCAGVCGYADMWSCSHVRM